MSHRDEITEVLAGKLSAVCFADSSESEGHSSGLIFPGSFNPWHEAHREMAKLAAEKLNRQVEFEVSITNVDKPPMGIEEIERRLAQFDAATPVWLTDAPTFLEKATIFPGATFIVGADTAVRLGQPDYYDTRKDREEAFAILRDFECRFLVFGRLLNSGFATLDGLDLDDDVATLCDGVTGDEFRVDTSSRELRDHKPSS